MLGQGWKAVRVFVLSETERYIAFMPAYISVGFLETDYEFEGEIFFQEFMTHYKMW